MVTMDYDLARAAGKDAADRSMKKAGRIHWNMDDYNEFVRMFCHLWPEDRDREAIKGADHGRT